MKNIVKNLDKMSNLDEINNLKLGFYLESKYYSSIEEDIVSLFNSEYPSQDYLNKCENDQTGVYEHILSLWYECIKNNLIETKKYNQKSVNKKFVNALYYKAVFLNDISNDEKIILLKEIINLDPNYIYVYGALFGLIIEKNLEELDENQKRENIKYINLILQTGYLKGCLGCTSFLCCIAIKNKDYLIAEKLNNLTYDIIMKNPRYNKKEHMGLYEKRKEIILNQKEI